jgi:hypothetical protein
MSYEAILTFFAHTRGDDADDVIQILCAMATAAGLVGTRRGEIGRSRSPPISRPMQG